MNETETLPPAHEAGHPDAHQEAPPHITTIAETGPLTLGTEPVTADLHPVAACHDWYFAQLGSHEIAPKPMKCWVKAHSLAEAKKAACEKMGVGYDHTCGQPRSPMLFECCPCCAKPTVEQLTKHGYYSADEAEELLK